MVIGFSSTVTPTLIDAIKFTWSFLFIEHWSNETPCNFLWNVWPTDQQLSQIALPALEAARPDDKLRSSWI